MQTEANVAASEALASRGPRVRRDRQFELEERLHDGELVEVWRATLSTGETAALKKLKSRYRAHSGAVELLRREHRTLAMLGRNPRQSKGPSRCHPGIVATLGFIERPDCCALLTEYLDGGDLVPLAGAAPRHWLEAALDVVAALEHVHARGVVHGDVKSRNVLFAGAGAGTWAGVEGEGAGVAGAKLIDFGSSAPIGAPLPRGGRTPAHEPRQCGFAEEFVRAGRLSEAQDVYALAVLLYELLTGRLPFGRGESGKEGQQGIGAGEGAPRGDPGRVAESAAGLRLSLAGALTRGPAPHALARRVMATLCAENAAGVGTLMQFRNVLESVRSDTPPALQKSGKSEAEVSAEGGALAAEYSLAEY